MSETNTIKLSLSLDEANIIELALRKYLRAGLEAETAQMPTDGWPPDSIRNRQAINKVILSTSSDVLGKLSDAVIKAEALS